jgi:hypothetical protein
LPWISGPCYCAPPAPALDKGIHPRDLSLFTFLMMHS